MVFGSIPDNSNIQEIFFCPGLKGFSTIMQLKSLGSDKRYYSVTCKFHDYHKDVGGITRNYYNVADVQSCQTV